MRPRSSRNSEPTRRQTERYVKTTRLRFPMELVVEFDSPVSVASARQTARRLLDALAAPATIEGPVSGEVQLRCAELRRILRSELSTPPEA